MAVNYMDRLAAMRGDRQQRAAGAHGRVSAPVLHADEARRGRKRKRKLSRKQKAALAKGRRVMAQMRRAKKRGRRHGAEESKMARKKRKRSHKGGARRVTHGRKAVARRKAYLARKRREGKTTVELHGKAARRYATKKYGRKRGRKVKHVKLHGTVAARYARSRKRKGPKRKRKHAMAHKRKSSKRSRAAKKAARTRARHKAERREAARKAARKRKRHGGHKRRGHKRRGGRRMSHKRRAPHRRRKHGRRRGGHARRRRHGLVRRSNRTGKFVGRGGRIHGRKRRGGYHRAGRIVREGYSMENPLDMGELATGLGAGLVGYIAADIADRMAAGKGPLGGTAFAEAAPIYSDYLRLGIGLGMAIAPLAGAHFIDGAKHRHIRAALQFFGFGAGIRTLGHIFNDLVASQLKNNSMVGPTVQALYPHEIIAAGQIAGAQSALAKTGAAGLPEQIGAEAHGLGLIPQGLAACCNATSRMLNPALSPLQPIGRSAEGGGAAAMYAPGPQALPPPIERIVQQPFAPPADRTRQATPIDVRTGQPALTPQPTTPPARAATVPAQLSAPAASMAAAYAPVAPAAGAVAGGGVNGLPQGPFSWGEETPG